MADERKWWWTTCATGGVDYAGVGFFCGTIWEALAHADEFCSLDGTTPRARPATPTEIAAYHLGPCGTTSSGGSSGGNTGIPLLLAKDGKLLATDDGFLKAGTDDTCCCITGDCEVCVNGGPGALDVDLPEGMIIPPISTIVYPGGCDAPIIEAGRYRLVPDPPSFIQGIVAKAPCWWYYATEFEASCAGDPSVDRIAWVLGVRLFINPFLPHDWLGLELRIQPFFRHGFYGADVIGLWGFAGIQSFPGVFASQDPTGLWLPQADCDRIDTILVSNGAALPWTVDESATIPIRAVA